ncbi:hypothetical protein CU098_006136 [Rhizopus stolonifer]|uniref:Uncharacterized protein n=1 Tax=Rhizopus stolonifer TaxID=4846 RepID=A0A367KHF6_RHIST|nr:hypothetical protein CU098_006136 [Rhizopus stolonifer]
MFAAHFILNLLANNLPTPDPGIKRPIFLTRPFFILACSKHWSQTRLPTQIDQYHPHILADIANKQAITFTSYVSEIFQRRAAQFFKFRLRELSQNAISNDNAKKLSLYAYRMKARGHETDFGGPTPVNLTTLSESSQDLADDVQTEASRRWVYEFLKTLPCYNYLGKYKRARIVTSIVNNINRQYKMQEIELKDSCIYMDTINDEQMPNTNRENRSLPEADLKCSSFIQTNVYAVGFISAKRTSTDVLSNLELEDFVPNEVQNTFRFWDLDPSQKFVFTAVDGHINDQHETRHFSAKELDILIVEAVVLTLA